MPRLIQFQLLPGAIDQLAASLGVLPMRPEYKLICIKDGRTIPTRHATTDQNQLTRLATALNKHFPGRTYKVVPVSSIKQNLCSTEIKK